MINSSTRRTTAIASPAAAIAAGVLVSFAVGMVLRSMAERLSAFFYVAQILTVAGFLVGAAAILVLLPTGPSRDARPHDHRSM